jgi:hypothetical protein
MGMQSQRQRWVANGRVGLGWGLAFFAGAQVLLGILMERVQPELRDPEYGYKLMRLEARKPELLDRPLIVILGSSRVGLGICPQSLQNAARSSRSPLVFNFAVTGAGAVTELLCLKRLLTAGYCPNQVIVEVLPPLYHEFGTWGEANWIDVHRLGWNDLRVMNRYVDHSWLLYARWIRARLTPWFSHRFLVMSRYAPGWLPWSCRQDGWRGLDETGWLPYPHTSVDAAEYQRGFDWARRQYLPSLDHYQISPRSDRALRELLDLCREKHISVLLLLMPEGSDFRNLYPAETQATVAAYLTQISHQYQVPLIDTRNWMPDTAFFDGHHLLPDGAVAYSERLARELLDRALRGQAWD